MTKRKCRKPVDRSRYRKYGDVAEHFAAAAKDSMEPGYWAASGVLIVHAAIAFADALCIKQAGLKSAGDDHEDAVALVEEVVGGGDEKAKAIHQLRRIIEEKTRVSYLGDLYSEKEIKEMWKRLERFRQWAKDILDR
jgi:hypothetical protein